MKKRKIGSPGFLLALALIFTFVAVNLIPSFLRYPSMQRARRVACASNLKQIGLGLKMYARDNGNAYPEILSKTSRHLNHTTSLFCCPSSDTEPGTFETVDNWTDYVYVPGLPESVPPDTVIMYCPAKNHKGEGGNVLFGDGHVEWFNAKGNASGEPSFDDVVGTIGSGTIGEPKMP